MGKILSIVRIAGVMLVLSISLGRLLILNALLGPTDARGFCFRRKFTRGSLWVLGVKTLKRGAPASAPVLYVSNHRSLVDPLIQLNVLDAYVVSKAEVANYPLIGPGAKATGVIFVQRQQTDSRAAAKDAIRQALREGKSVLIYPEGTTSNEETVQDFKIGSFQIASEEGVGVVPVAVDYADPRDYWFAVPMLQFFLRKFSKRRIRAALSIGTPIYAQDARVLMEQSRQWMEDEIRSLRATLRTS